MASAPRLWLAQSGAVASLSTVSPGRHIHLFAVDADGLTALGRASCHSQCSSLLLAATQRALQQATADALLVTLAPSLSASLPWRPAPKRRPPILVLPPPHPAPHRRAASVPPSAWTQATISILYCKREDRAFVPHVAAVRHELSGTFPGLRVISKPLSAVAARGAHEAVEAGTFDVVWEAPDWRHTRLLYARAATGSFPPPGALTRAVMNLILGPGMPAGLQLTPARSAVTTAPRAHSVAPRAQAAPPSRAAWAAWRLAAASGARL